MRRDKTDVQEDEFPPKATASSDERVRPRRTLTLLQVLVFYAIIILLNWLTSVVFQLPKLSAWFDLAFTSSAYSLLVVPVACWFDPRIFGKAYWQFRPLPAIVGISVIIFVQLIMESEGPMPPVNPFRKFGAILIAPFVEELARAVMICPLTEKLGTAAGIAITALLWAGLHQYFWSALIQQTILSLIFVYSRRSLPAAIAAHTAMNAIAAWHIGFNTLLKCLT